MKAFWAKNSYFQKGKNVFILCWTENNLSCKVNLKKDPLTAAQRLRDDTLLLKNMKISFQLLRNIFFESLMAVQYL